MNKQDEYSKYYKDPRWQKKRLKIFERDRFSCDFCGSKRRTLVVHHFWYGQIEDKKTGEWRDRLPWEYKDEFLITLCEKCHEKEHASRAKNESTLLDRLRIWQFSSEDIERLNEAIYNMDDLIKPFSAVDTIWYMLSDYKLMRKMQALTFLVE